MNKIKLSVVLATRNEEENLDRCLESVRQLADEIVVADEKSTDKTVEIARKFEVRVIFVPHNENFHISKNVAIDAASGGWILQLDADEIVSPELAKEIKSVIKNTTLNGFMINRKNWFLGRFLTKGGQYPDSTLRLYRRGKGRLPAKDVHEQAQVQGAIGHLQHDLLHYRDTSFAKYLDGFNRYSSFIASQIDPPINLWQTFNYLVVKPAVTFGKIYFRHRGYVDKFPGLVFALFSGLIYPVAYIKYWQHKYYPA